MPTIATKIISDQSEIPPGVTPLATEALPMLRGDGDISHECGSCGVRLIEDVSEGDLMIFWAQCPRCRSIGQVLNPGAPPR